MSDTPLDSVLVADRGPVAVLLLQALQRLDVRAVTVHVGADAHAEHVRAADESVLLADDGYGDVVQVVEAARQSRAHGVHPGTGPLAGSVPALRAVQDAGLVWVDALGEDGEALEVALARQTGRTLGA